MKHLIKNFGLTALGLCILISSAAIETRLSSIEDKLAQATKLNASLAQVQASIPASVLVQ